MSYNFLDIFFYKSFFVLALKGRDILTQGEAL